MTQPDHALGSLSEIIERFDHFSIAVRDIDASHTLVTLMGGSPAGGGFDDEGNFDWVQFDLPGQGRLEMISPATPDPDHFLNRFLAQNGEGLHHLTFKVADITAAVAHATELGFTVVGFNDTNPDWKEAFIHPASAHGVLIQFAEFTEK